MAARQNSIATLSLLTGATIWGLIWYPYRIIDQAGINGVVASMATYAFAFLLGLAVFRRQLRDARLSWWLPLIALAAGGCNLGYVLAVLNGEVMRVLLLFYLSPLWTVLLSRLLLGERLHPPGVAIIGLSLCGAIVMLWRPELGMPWPQHGAEWIGLGAGFMFALNNVLIRRTGELSIELKSMVSFLGVIVICSDGLILQDKGWIGVLMLLLAVVLYAVSGILVQRETYQAHPLVITVGALILSLPLFLLLWWTTDGHLPQINWSSHSPWAVLYLAVFGSLIGFMSYFYIVKKRGATLVSMVTLATPMFALYLGHHYNGEQISMQLVIGSVLVLSGLCLYFLSLNKSESEALMPTEIEKEQRV